MKTQRQLQNLLVTKKQEQISNVKKIKKQIEKENRHFTKIDKNRQIILDRLPNLLHQSVPWGKSEQDNVVIRKWGSQPHFPFKPRAHLELLLLLDLAELERARKVSGARFYFLKDKLVILELALIRFALDLLVKEGFTIFSTPTIVRKEALYGTGFLPAGEDDIYKIEGEPRALIGTSEVPLGAFHQSEVLLETDLPRWYAGLSTCYRTEASATTKDDKGIFRVHEFKKVEMFKFTHPATSWDEHEHLLSIAEKVYRQLELHYQIVNICTGDIGSTAAKKYDLEVWLPGQLRYRELCSCSNCTDYQSRRMKIRYREKPGAPIKGYVHTLNSTALATTRTIIAILENYQQDDGSVLIPKALQKYTNFDRINLPKQS